MTNPKYGVEIFAWVFDDPTGTHGIPATMPVPMPDTTGKMTMTAMPLVTTQRHLAIGKMRYAARCAAELTGVPIQLLHYVFEGVIDEIDP
jgi:hypothetical protein